MKALLQRVTHASVTVEDEVIAEIGPGLLVLLGVAPEDEESDLNYLVEKTYGLRVFSDKAGKMNLSVADIEGGVLVVSQFTLYADCRKGRRPSFTGAAAPEKARAMYESYARRLAKKGLVVKKGRFGNTMEVSLCNDGPVTIMLDSSRSG